MENQDLLFCGKHAINNMLQMEKLVSDATDKRLLIAAPGAAAPSDPLDPDVQINMAEFCKRRDRLNRKSLRHLPEPQLSMALENLDRCDSANGFYTYDLLKTLIETQLRFRAIAEFTMDRGARQGVDILRDFLKENIKKPNLVGFIFNYDNGHHWTTMLVNSAACPPSIPKRRSQAYTLIDSHPPTVECYTRLETLIRTLEDKNTTMVMAITRERYETLEVTMSRLHIGEELARYAIEELGFDIYTLNQEDEVGQRELAERLQLGQIRVPVPVRTTAGTFGFGAAAVEPVLAYRGNHPRYTGPILKELVAGLPPVHTIAEAKAQLMGLGFPEARVDRAIAAHGMDVPAAFAFLRRGVAATRKVVRSPCPPGQVRNRATKECRDKGRAGRAAKTPCPPGQVRNRETKACRDKKKAGRQTKKAKAEAKVEAKVDGAN